MSDTLESLETELAAYWESKKLTLDDLYAAYEDGFQQAARFVIMDQSAQDAAHRNGIRRVLLLLRPELEGQMIDIVADNLSF